MKQEFDLVSKIHKIFLNGRHEMVNFCSLTTGMQYLKLYRFTKKYIKLDFEVLDWGAGYGHFSIFLEDIGCHKITDFSFDDFSYKDFVSKRYKFIQVDKKDPVKIPFEDESFNAIFSIGVLEHVREFGGNFNGSLKEINRLLKPDGIFICYHFPNKYSWIENFSGILPNKFHHPDKFNKKEIIALLKDNNFQISEIGKYHFLPRTVIAKVLPLMIVNSKTFLALFNSLDFVLSKTFSFFNEYYYFVVKKK